MKKKLTLKLIESNESPKIGDLVFNGINYSIYTSKSLRDSELSNKPLKLIKPIGISDEEITSGDWYLNNNKTIMRCGKKQESLLDSGKYYEIKPKKIELLPEHFSDDILQLIVEDKLKDGDDIEVDYRTKMQQYPDTELDDIEVLVLDSNDKAIISISESINQRVEKALQSTPTTVEEVISKMYAKAHTKLEKRPSPNDGNFNYIHQIDTLNLIEETGNEVSKIMYSEEEVKGLFIQRCKAFGTKREPFFQLLLKQDLEWFEENKKK